MDHAGLERWYRTRTPDTHARGTDIREIRATGSEVTPAEAEIGGEIYQSPATSREVNDFIMETDKLCVERQNPKAALETHQPTSVSDTRAFQESIEAEIQATAGEMKQARVAR